MQVVVGRITNSEMYQYIQSKIPIHQIVATLKKDMAPKSREERERAKQFDEDLA